MSAWTEELRGLCRERCAYPCGDTPCFEVVDEPPCAACLAGEPTEGELELGAKLAPDEPVEQQVKLVRLLREKDPDKLATLRRLIEVGEALNRGERPPGVIICREH